MLFRKTLTTERDKYVYRFNDGTVSVITEGSEAEVWIKSLHSFDDAEVYNNIKNSRPQLEPWQKKALEEWKAQHPGEEPDKNWNLSMDGLMMTENPDTSVYAKQLTEMTAEEPDPMKELLYEKLSELPEDDQDLYRLYYIEEYSQEQIAKMKGVSQNTVSKKLRRIARQAHRVVQESGIRPEWVIITEYGVIRRREIFLPLLVIGYLQKAIMELY